MDELLQFLDTLGKDYRRKIDPDTQFKSIIENFPKDIFQSKDEYFKILYNLSIQKNDEEKQSSDEDNDESRQIKQTKLNKVFAYFINDLNNGLNE
jgi:hypothetical protein